MKRQTIYVAGYPKSGCTWLTRLLAEVLNSPSGGCRPGDDKNEVATEGQNRKGGFVVRKGHFRPVPGGLYIVPTEHRLAIDKITNERVVMIHRDPRDVIVSGAYYWRRNINEQMEMVIRGNGKMRVHGAWNVFINEWMNYENEDWFVHISYEALLENTLQVVRNILIAIEIEMPVKQQIRQAISNQSFMKKRKELIENPNNPKYNSKFHNHFMRRGKTGDWRRYFDEKMDFRVQSHFGHWMKYLGYLS